MSLAKIAGTAYCLNFGKAAPTRIIMDSPLTIVKGSPVPAVGDSLFTFMVGRMNGAWPLLGCDKLLATPVPFTVVLDANGVVIAGNIDPAFTTALQAFIAQQAAAKAAAATTAKAAAQQAAAATAAKKAAARSSAAMADSAELMLAEADEPALDFLAESDAYDQEESLIPDSTPSAPMTIDGMDPAAPADPAPVAADPAPVAADPAPVSADPAAPADPVAADPAPVDPPVNSADYTDSANAPSAPDTSYLFQEEDAASLTTNMGAMDTVDAGAVACGPAADAKADGFSGLWFGVGAASMLGLVAVVSSGMALARRKIPGLSSTERDNMQSIHATQSDSV
jgi:hypothetical protein